MSDAIPVAQVRWVGKRELEVRCPYCGDLHKHPVNPGRLRGPEHRAPACGMTLPADERGMGYTFDLPQTPGGAPPRPARRPPLA